MSFVSGVTLITGVSDDGHSNCWIQVQAWLTEHNFAPLAILDDHYSGTKHPQCCVNGGGFNYFPENDFAAFVMGLDWNCPENVVLIIEPEEGATRVWRPDAREQEQATVEAIAAWFERLGREAAQALEPARLPYYRLATEIRRRTWKL